MYPSTSVVQLRFLNNVIRITYTDTKTNVNSDVQVLNSKITYLPWVIFYTSRMQRN